jgi:hypothetical protein
MRSVKVTRPGDRSVADHLADMEGWLERAGIRGTVLEPVRILYGRVVFSATFQELVDADRFLAAFGNASPEPRGVGRDRGGGWQSGWPQ